MVMRSVVVGGKRYHIQFSEVPRRILTSVGIELIQNVSCIIYNTAFVPVSSGNAACAPEDTFSFARGALLSLARACDSMERQGQFTRFDSSHLLQHLLRVTKSSPLPSWYAIYAPPTEPLVKWAKRVLSRIDVPKLSGTAKTGNAAGPSYITGYMNGPVAVGQPIEIKTMGLNDAGAWRQSQVQAVIDAQRKAYDARPKTTEEILTARKNTVANMNKQTSAPAASVDRPTFAPGEAVTWNTDAHTGEKFYVVGDAISTLISEGFEHRYKNVKVLSERKNIFRVAPDRVRIIDETMTLTYTPEKVALRLWRDSRGSAVASKR